MRGAEPVWEPGLWGLVSPPRNLGLWDSALGALRGGSLASLSPAGAQESWGAGRGVGESGGGAGGRRLRFAGRFLGKTLRTFLGAKVDGSL